ncbi:phage portal protein [Planctomicrobium sp. SH661]|uniref:phage portal protein n=1 Tax=Planctomicrobium sp. SH661 TaxID=3448124 RepID=UPI003F5BD7B3
MRDRTTLLRRAFHGIADAWEAVSPRYAKQRQEARHQLIMQERAQRMVESYFDGADVASRLRADRWLSSRLSPDSALESDLEELRERSNQLYRDFGFITGAVEHRVDNVVGTGLNPKAWLKSREGVITEDQANRWSEELDDVYERWAPNAGGTRVSFGSLQRLALRTWRLSGDGFPAISDMGRADSPIPLQIDIVAPHRIETPPHKLGDKKCRLGIQRDAQDQIVGYWVRETHPHDTIDNSDTHRFYPLDRMTHLFEQLFPHQSRGLPWCFSIMSDCRDFADYKEAVIIAAQVAACQTMNIHTNNPDLLARAMADGFGLTPGRVNVVGLQEQITAFNPTQPQTTYDMFTQSNLLGMAAGLNYPSSWLMRDRRRATYSAGKLDEIDGAIPLRSDFEIVKNNMIRPIWSRLVLESIIVGESSIPIDLYLRVPHLFNRFKLVATGRQWSDPLKEVTAAILAKEHNIGSLTAILQRLGLDVDDVFETRHYEKQREEELEIVPPIYAGNLPPDNSDETEDPEDPAADDKQDAEMLAEFVRLLKSRKHKRKAVAA